MPPLWGTAVAVSNVSHLPLHQKDEVKERQNIGKEDMLTAEAAKAVCGGGGCVKHVTFTLSSSRTGSKRQSGSGSSGIGMFPEPWS